MLLKPGDMFGDYRVVRNLGSGGMAEVWLLEIESRREYCAVKLLDPEKALDRTVRRRFLTEAQLEMSVASPSVLSVYDIGEDPVTGLCYIIMEYAPGGTLADRLAFEGVPPFAEALALVRELAVVLEDFRARGIVHRDLKPSNVLFAADGSVRLADLGAARVNGQSGRTVAPDCTARLGVMVGTPAYMAPEQMIDPRGVDGRADIYSLGVIFFELLTGVRPTGDETAVEIMARAVTGRQLPDVRTLRPDVPASVANIINIMCAQDPSDRVDSPQWIADCCGRMLERGE